jgi:hypothetical protein
MRSQTGWSSLLLFTLFLLPPLGVRADGEKEAEALRKEIQALRDEAARRERDLLELKKGMQENLKRTQQQIDEVSKRIEEQNRQLLQEKQRTLEEREARIKAEIEAKQFKARAVHLEEQVRRLEQRLQEQIANSLLRPLGSSPLQQEKNFPKEQVEGRVTQIDKESGLLKLSVGADAGLKKGHHLHIYRLDAKPEKAKYLGTIEILNVRATEAVARLTRKLPGDLVIQVGDRVMSQLTPQEKK